MEIQITDKFCIFTPLTPRLDERETMRLFDDIKQYKDYEIGIDLSFVQDCTVEFLDELRCFSKEKGIGIFNIASDIFTIFNFMQVDKQINLFVNESDFKLNKHRLLNRKFNLV